ncbi:MAG: DJ-1/PfpI family protein [Sedimentisphaerales bacterium]
MVSSIKKIGCWTICCIMILLASEELLFGQPIQNRRASGRKVIQLPAPSLMGSVSVEEAISRQQSVRGFADKPLSYVQMGQLAWAGLALAVKDVNNRGGNPLEMYFLTAEGLFIYQPGPHSLEQVSPVDLRKQLSTTAGQEAIAQAGCDIIIAGAMKKTPPKPGSKAMKFMPLAAGQAAENIRLQAAALGLGAVLVDEFEARDVERVCRLSGDTAPLLIVSVGFPAEQKSQDKPAMKPAGADKKAVLIVPAINFRDQELLLTQRILTESGIKVVLASSKTGLLKGMIGGTANSEITLDKVQFEDFNAVVFIGGMGAAEYYNNPSALEIARQAAATHKIIAAISTAPAILANAGVLKGVRATGFLSEREQMLKGGAKYTGTSLERDGLIITSSDFTAAAPFAMAIADAIRNTD